MKTFGHKRPVRDSAGAIIDMKDSPARAVILHSAVFAGLPSLPVRTIPAKRNR